MLAREQIEYIKDIANEKIDFVLSDLGFDVDNMIMLGHEMRSACPIHGGKNESSFSYSLLRKTWCCYSNNCHNKMFDIFGLTRLILGQRLNRQISFMESAKYLCKLLELEIDIDANLEVDAGLLTIHRLIKESKVKQNVESFEERQINKSQKFKPFSIDLIKDTKPSELFLQEGFTEPVLKKYYVGYCDDPKKPMYLRSYAPVLDDIGANVIGVTGRTSLPKCDFCSSHHYQGRGCPHENKEVKAYPKWFHYGFYSGATLYNIWSASEYIKKFNTVILTEGPKDVWWFEQHGIHHSLCIFGLNISSYQIQKMAKLNVLRVILALDKDERGMEGTERLTSQLGRYFKVSTLNRLLESGEDIADVPSERMNRIIVPYLNK